uniref:Uncharacterized protein n=1 Tax=Solanum lycopersicum TaxID=4081 RepID=A0A3Q7J9I5_SOLLC
MTRAISESAKPVSVAIGEELPQSNNTLASSREPPPTAGVANHQRNSMGTIASTSDATITTRLFKLIIPVMKCMSMEFV